MKSKWAGIRAYWIDENSKKCRMKPDYGLISINLKKLIGLICIEDESSTSMANGGIHVSYGADKMRFIYRDDGTVDKTS